MQFGSPFSVRAAAARCSISCLCPLIGISVLLTVAIGVAELRGVFSLSGLSRRFYGMRVVPVSPCQQPPKYHLAMMTIFKNMKPYLNEWIDFHLMVGFDHFYLYNNNSTDSPEEELAKYIQRGQVTMHDFPSQFRVAYDGVRENYSQKAAVLDALTRYRCQAKWIALLDMDEFVFSPLGTQLPQVLQRYDAYGGVSLAWLRFGTSSHMLPPEMVTIEGYTFRMRRPSNNFKNIVQPARVAGIQDIHEIIFHSGYYSVDERYRPVMRETNRNVNRSYKVLRLHHYFTRSYLDWFLRVYDRGSVSGAVHKYQLGDLRYYGRANEMYDPSALFLAEGLKARMGFNGTLWRSHYFHYNSILHQLNAMSALEKAAGS
eukprot:scpid55952/ scgid0269/ UPF0392 protein RCOM_0530710